MIETNTVINYKLTSHVIKKRTNNKIRLNLSAPSTNRWNMEFYFLFICIGAFVYWLRFA